MTRNRNSAPEAEEVIEVEADEASAEVTFSAKDLANELGIDAKSFRRWLRSVTPERANKGGRWIFNEETKAAFVAAYQAKGTQGTQPTAPESE